MTGIYLKCDVCHVTALGGEEVSDHPQGLGRFEGRRLIEAARERGWTIRLKPPRKPNEWRDRDVLDVCPACSAKVAP